MEHRVRVRVSPHLGQAGVQPPEGLRSFGTVARPPARGCGEVAARLHMQSAHTCTPHAGPQEPPRSSRHELDAHCRAEPVALTVAADALRLGENKVALLRPAGSPKLLRAPKHAPDCPRPRLASANLPVRPRWRWPATPAALAGHTGRVFYIALRLTEAPIFQQFSHVPPERRKQRRRQEIRLAVHAATR